MLSTGLNHREEKVEPPIDAVSGLHPFPLPQGERTLCDRPTSLEGDQPSFGT